MVAAPQVLLARAMGWRIEPGGRGVPAEAMCGWCGSVGPVCDVIPPEFTQWGQIRVDPDAPWLCPDCGGALVGLKPVRWGHAMVTTSGVGEMSDNPADLRAWLSEPVGSDRCVMVQANRQKRSVLAARWGAVATTWQVPGIAWEQRDVDRLGWHERLRWVHGVSEREIDEAAPRHKTLAASPDPVDLLELWRGVRSWDTIRLEISKLATRRPKGGDEDGNR